MLPPTAGLLDPYYRPVLLIQKEETAPPLGSSRCAPVTFEASEPAGVDYLPAGLDYLNG